MIRSIISQSNDPSFNLATEEFLLRNSEQEIHFFYINKPSVIIGKHQNALAEINLAFLEENNIPLYRRQSGGGTVYHDFGNINFCFIRKGEQGDLVNFKRATQPIIEVLNQWNIPARNGERNDLLVNFKKISGNACHVFKRRVMHHGTLLYNSDLQRLNASLRNDPSKFKDRAVKSIRSEVMNISELYGKEITSKEFMQNLANAIISNNRFIINSELTHDEQDGILKLQKDKYSTNEWNYNYGPNYEFRKRTVVENWVYAIHMKVERGRINSLSIKSNNPDKNLINNMINSINGSFHQKETIADVITRFNNNEKTKELVEIFF
ncbi:MAG TPA: lipoate--protein ligase [Marinilabiliaceae bacterium]|nr:lipoate--protein ligase [Marinilabiliaceae bacterium]